MTDKKQQSVTDILKKALQEVEEEHGIVITRLRAYWLDASDMARRKSYVVEIEIEADLT